MQRIIQITQGLREVKRHSAWMRGYQCESEANPAGPSVEKHRDGKFGNVEEITTGVVYSLPGDIRPRLAITARSSSGSTGFAKCT